MLREKHAGLAVNCPRLTASKFDFRIRHACMLSASYLLTLFTGVVVMRLPWVDALFAHGAAFWNGVACPGDASGSGGSGSSGSGGGGGGAGLGDAPGITTNDIYVYVLLFVTSKYRYKTE